MMNSICFVTRIDDILEHGERMNKRHKWIARKRNAAGKWIYDYGNGFPGEGKNSKNNQWNAVSRGMYESMRLANASPQRRKHFKNVRADSYEYTRHGGNKVFKTEDNQAYVRSRYNPYKAHTYGRTAGEASRKHNSQLQKRQHSIKMPNGGRYVY